MYRISLMIFLSLFVAKNAFAEDRWYGSLHAGSTITPEIEIEGGLLGTDTKPGVIVGASVGRKFGDFRGELELSHRKNNLDTLSTTLTPVVGGVTVNANGDVKSNALMVNGFYDFNIPDTNFTPYLGLGIGVARISMNIGISAGTFVNDKATEFSYQAIAGSSWEFGNGALFAQYKFFKTINPNFTTPDGVDFDTNLMVHSVDLGVRFYF